MSLLMLALFLAACGLGLWSVRGISAGSLLPVLALQTLLSVIVLLGMLIVFAEAGRVLARYAGLAGLFFASATLTAALGAMERAVRHSMKSGAIKSGAIKSGAGGGE